MRKMNIVLLITAVTVIGIGWPLLSNVHASGDLEWGINRPGGDYKSFDLPVDNPIMCKEACAGDPQCKAMVYGLPGDPYPKRCWLKLSVTSTTSVATAVTWVKPNSGDLEWGINRPGGDYKQFVLPVDNPIMCKDLCAGDPRCKAMVYGLPGDPYPKRCWLKSSVKSTTSDATAVSWVKPK